MRGEGADGFVQMSAQGGTRTKPRKPRHGDALHLSSQDVHRFWTLPSVKVDLSIRDDEAKIELDDLSRRRNGPRFDPAWLFREGLRVDRKVSVANVGQYGICLETALRFLPNIYKVGF